MTKDKIQEAVEKKLLKDKRDDLVKQREALIQQANMLVAQVNAQIALLDELLVPPQESAPPADKEQ